MNEFELPELPKSFEINLPELNCDTVNSLGRGLENKGIYDIYEAVYYGFLEGRNRSKNCIPDEIFTVDQMREYTRKAIQMNLERRSSKSIWYEECGDAIRTQAQEIVAAFDHAVASTPADLALFSMANKGELAVKFLRSIISNEDTGKAHKGDGNLPPPFG